MKLIDYHRRRAKRSEPIRKKIEVHEARAIIETWENMRPRQWREILFAESG